MECISQYTKMVCAMQNESWQSQWEIHFVSSSSCLLLLTSLAMLSLARQQGKEHLECQIQPWQHSIYLWHCLIEFYCCGSPLSFFLSLSRASLIESCRSIGSGSGGRVAPWDFPGFDPRLAASVEVSLHGFLRHRYVWMGVQVPKLKVQ